MTNSAILYAAPSCLVVGTAPSADSTSGCTAAAGPAGPCAICLGGLDFGLHSSSSDVVCSAIHEDRPVAMRGCRCPHASLHYDCAV